MTIASLLTNLTAPFDFFSTQFAITVNDYWLALDGFLCFSLAVLAIFFIAFLDEYAVKVCLKPWVKWYLKGVGAVYSLIIFSIFIGILSGDIRAVRVSTIAFHAACLVFLIGNIISRMKLSRANVPSSGDQRISKFDPPH
jgi:hypothetical protein